MTLSECREAARKGLPVVHTAMISCHISNIVYARVSQVGYTYGADGKEKPFVQLTDVSGHSVTYTKPEDVILEIDFIKKQKEKEKESA